MYTFVKQHTHVHVYKYSTSRRSLNVRPIAERVWTVLPPTHKTHAYLRSSAFSCICVPVRVFAFPSVRSRLRLCVCVPVRACTVASVSIHLRTSVPCTTRRVHLCACECAWLKSSSIFSEVSQVLGDYLRCLLCNYCHENGCLKTSLARNVPNFFSVRIVVRV